MRTVKQLIDLNNRWWSVYSRKLLIEINDELKFRTRRWIMFSFFYRTEFHRKSARSISRAKCTWKPAINGSNWTFSKSAPPAHPIEGESRSHCLFMAPLDSTQEIMESGWLDYLSTIAYFCFAATSKQDRGHRLIWDHRFSDSAGANCNFTAIESFHCVVV